MIVCAAIRFQLKKNSKEIILCGVRHADCYETLSKLGYKQADCFNFEEGFMTNDGEFLDRRYAKIHAVFAQQIDLPLEVDLALNANLYSEDLY